MFSSLLINTIILLFVEFNCSAFDSFQIIIVFLEHCLFLSDSFHLRIDFGTGECACAFQSLPCVVNSFLDIGNVGFDCALLVADPFLSLSEIVLNDFQTSRLDFPFDFVGDFVELGNWINISSVGSQLQILAVKCFEVGDSLIEFGSEQFDFFRTLFGFFLSGFLCLSSFLLCR